MIRRAESGEFDGHTPVKGTDYFTASEIQQIQNEVSSGAIGEFKSVVDTETETFNTNAESKLNAYNQNDSQKKTAYTTQPSKISIDLQNNKVSLKPFKVVSMTSWLAYGGYAARSMMTPSSFAPQEIILRGNRKEMKVIM